MRTAILFIRNIVLSLSILYAGVWFITFQTNPLLWSDLARIEFVLIAAFCLFCSGAAASISQEGREEKSQADDQRRI
ncbi:MAG: hypothetical protein V4714_17660 [Bacteroidota bacterium]